MTPKLEHSVHLGKHDCGITRAEMVERHRKLLDIC